MNENWFKESDDRVSYYTGLSNFETLLHVFNLVSVVVPEDQHQKLSNFQYFVLTCMKLRLDLGFEDLGFRFNVHCSTASRIFDKWLNVMYVRLKFLISWPEREVLRTSLPQCFVSAYPKACCIIDCSEVFIERPSNLLARAETWSNYKSHNTVKFLIGITPQGTVSFLSKVYGGRASDKEITENCGIFDHLLPGDQVLADRGFTCTESFALYSRAELVIPAFTKGRPQMPAVEVMYSREIANVRIHIERVIGGVKNKYTILQHILPIKLIMDSDNNLSKVDKLVTTCCALFNLCPPIVPTD